MNIVILDGYAMNPGDLDYDDLDKLGTVTVYPRTDPEDVITRSKDADVILTNKVAFSSEHFEKLPKLKYIGVQATGFNTIDVIAANAADVVVTNSPGYSTQSVAQHVFALLLALTNSPELHTRACRSGKWAACPDFCFWEKPIVELENITMGIIGFGEIGKSVARIAQSFGMKTIAHSRSEFSEPLTKQVDLSELLQSSDVISLHCPLTDKTDKLINTDRLQLIKKSAILINTARGAVIDEQAVADALNNEQLAGFGADVLSTEPPSANNPLLSAKNAIITPHIAWASRAARQRLMDIIVNNLKAFINGQPINVVS